MMTIIVLRRGDAEPPEGAAPQAGDWIREELAGGGVEREYWTPTSAPPPPPPELSRQQFARLFTVSQLMRLELVMAQAAELTAAQIGAALAGAGPIAHGRLLVVRVAYRRLETADVVDLARPEVVAYLATLRNLGVIESDAELARIANRVAL
jgi:hypothetical protein